MKKLIILSSLFLLLGAGCSRQATEIPRSVASLPTIRDDKFNKEQKIMRNLVQHKDLAGEYSRAVIKTNKGDITVEFYSGLSPVTVNNFLNLSQQGFYDGTKFHRVIPDFMIQGGDPNTKTDNAAAYGTGGPDYRFDDEFNTEKLTLGSLAMANSGPDTNGSQFFIVTAPATPWLDGKHTNFGFVVAGMEVVEAIEKSETDARDNPVEPVIIEKIELID